MICGLTPCDAIPLCVIIFIIFDFSNSALSDGRLFCTITLSAILPLIGDTVLLILDILLVTTVSCVVGLNVGLLLFLFSEHAPHPHKTIPNNRIIFFIYK